MKNYLYLSGGTVCYTKWGIGPKLMIALHGFGHDHHMFNILKQGLQSNYTVIAIDLPFHGDTKWKASHFDRSFVLELIQTILRQEKYNTASILGFSLGARLWLSCFATLEPFISEAFFLAPDGIKTQWLNIFENIPPVFINGLKKNANNSNSLIKCSEKLRKWKMINHFSSRFVRFHLSTFDKRERLFGTWLSLRFFRVRKEEIRKVVTTSPKRLCIVVGKKDGIISLQAIKRFVDGLPNTELHILDKSHSLIDGSIAEIISGIRRIY